MIFSHLVFLERLLHRELGSGYPILLQFVCLIPFPVGSVFLVLHISAHHLPPKLPESPFPRSPLLRTTQTPIDFDFFTRVSRDSRSLSLIRDLRYPSMSLPNDPFCTGLNIVYLTLLFSLISSSSFPS